MVATSYEMRFTPGSYIEGKWNRARYRVERLLGEGANGRVYLVERQQGMFALKLGNDAVDLQSEANVLRSLDKQRRSGQAFLIDVDDYRGSDGEELPFYVMRYVRGQMLADYLRDEGVDWFPLTGLHLLGKLAALHEAGWAFGDLKQENVLVAKYGKVELVDYGGVTAMGRGVRQFTELYDRGYWNAGSRIADAGYDLFSFAVLAIQLFEGNRLVQMTKTMLPPNRTVDGLLKLAVGNAALKPYEGWLRKALHSQFASTREAAAQWQQLMYRSGKAKSAPLPLWMRGLFAASLALLASTVVWLVYYS